MKLIKATDGSKHQVRKYIINDDGEESVWSNTWYGRHVIGNDCEWLDESTSLPSSSVTGESEAIAVIEFLLDVNANGLKGDRFHKIEMCDGDFYWETDKDGDQPMDGKDIYNIYKNAEGKKTPQ